MSKKVFFVLILLLVVVFVGYVLLAKGPTQESPSLDISLSSDISDWNIYRNNEYHFAFAYPPDWYTDEYKRTEDEPSSNTSEFSVALGSLSVLRQDYVAGVFVYRGSYEQTKRKIFDGFRPGLELESTEDNIFVGGREWTKLLIHESGVPVDVSADCGYHLEMSSYTFRVACGDTELGETILKMLSTFQFGN